MKGGHGRIDRQDTRPQRGPCSAWLVLGTLAFVGLAAVACAPGVAPAGPTPPAAPPTTAPAAAAPTTAPPAAKPTAAVPAAAPQVKAAPIPLNVSYSALVASQSLAWIALETGLFSKHGLDVNLQYITSSSQGTAALLSGSVDAAIIGGIGIMGAVIQGGDVKLIGASKNQLAGRIMARPEIKSPEDLRGKRVSVTGRGSNTEYMAIQALKRFGLEPGRDYTFVYAGGEVEAVAALANNSSQASSSVPPNDKKAEQVGAHELIDVTKLVVKYPATCIAASGNTIRTKPEALQRMVAAMKEAVQVYKKDPETALRVIGKYTKTDDVETLRWAYEIERGIMADDLKVDPEAIKAAIEEIAVDRPEARQKTYADFVDDRFLQ